MNTQKPTTSAAGTRGGAPGRRGRLAGGLAVVLVAAAMAFVVSAGPASAGVGLAATPDWPTAVTVGQTGLTGSLEIPNRSNGSEGVGNVTLSSITLVPACGALASENCPVASADPGVFQLGPTGTGSLAGCAGTSFAISVIDADQGKVRFTPGTPVVLGPPGASNDTCRIGFSFSVLKAPSKDALTNMEGVQSAQLGYAAGTHDTELPGTGTGTDITMVNRATPTIATQVTPTAVAVGQSFTDTATVTGSAGAPSPTGTVTFLVSLDSPTAEPCSGPTQTLGPVALAPVAGSSPPAASATSPPVTATGGGTYRFRVSYSGDANYGPLGPTPCNEPNESVTVRLTPLIATQVTPTSGTTTVGQPVSDTATVTGAQGGPVPTGTVTFTVHFDAPGAAPCSGPSQTLGPVTLAPVPGSNPPAASAASGSVTAAGPGTYRFRATYSGDASYAALPMTACAIPNENVDVTKAVPTIVTTASDPIGLGGPVHDTATLAGGANPTGTITFTLYGPDDDTCAGTPASTSTRTVNGNGIYTSEPFTPTAPGRYRFVATYSGDANNAAVGPTACNDPDEDVEVAPVTTTTTAVASTTTAPPAVLGTLLTLPRTGAGVAGMSLAALLVMAGGGLLVAVAVRRRSGLVEPSADPEG